MRPGACWQSRPAQASPHLCRFSAASCSRPSSRVASWISSVASFPADVISRESANIPGQTGLLTEAHEGVAGPGVAGEGQLPAGPVREAAAKGVLAVVHEAGLELEGKRP